MKLKIVVEHEISSDPKKCTYDGDLWGKDVCCYHAHRDRIHGKKLPRERNMPKCILFNCWLDGEYQKCPQCIEASKIANMQNIKFSEV